MNQRTHSSTLLAVLLAALFSVSATYAESPSTPSRATLPHGYPKAIQSMGVILDIDTGTVTVNGSRYTLSISLVVHSPSGEGSRFELREGVEIGFSYTQEPNGILTISEIWVLPKGTYVPS